ncbi:MAG: phosphodiester glycosidase family protein [Hassallia sp. WJT32-NPBG1]|nr:phosphodiester glycosidase family protein [Hassallia sp. WJT32-NPBG1]
MLNFCREEDRKAIANKGNRKFFPTFVSPIISTILCFYATSPTLAQQSPVEVKLAPILTQQSPRPPLTGVISYGNQILLNGRTLPATWLQKRSKSGSFTTHLSDGALRQLVGVDLLNSTNPSRQPVQWFSLVTKPIVLSSVLAGGYRYLDITNFAKTAKWQMQVNGNTLVISTPAAKVTDISQSPQSSTVGVAPLQQARIVVNLDRPTAWQIRQGLSIKKALPPDPDTVTPKTSAPPNREWIITLDGIADPVLLQRYTTQEPAPAPLQLPNFLKQLPPVIIPAPIPEPTPEPTPEPLIQQVEVVNNQTIIHLSVPFGLAPRISTVVNPDRLIIDIRPDALVEKDITWAQGVRWRQQVVNLGTERFPVVWLEVNPRTVGLKLKPMVTNANTLTGTAPLIQTAQQYLPVAAINGGYFNRNNRLPLGAIRRDNQWLSSPILNRGAIAWNDSGQFYFGRLTLAETLATSNNQQLPILFINSGYVQSGIARYSPAWGTYSFLTDNEIILVVQNNQVTNQFLGGKAGESSIPVTIPQNGYLLVLRGNAVNSAAQLPIGTTLRISSATTPVDFSRYPNIVGAGPLLVQNNQIVLDAKAEKFSDAFIAEKAIRSAICTTATGTVMIAAVHNRAGGAGPTLTEHAQLMQRMGCVNALNLDGGSSTSLYLGGQLLDRSPNTAARVHNGIGIFLQPR